ncbi:putative aminoacrylate hydrolase RutD [Acidithrix ferrooxidans]|uniref:Putative aminoacrylate hydrolase RutD n=1 Tax=Acidithrix ferrooxidans TaxID=1280514 RepID=A0A0D8HIZ9_9ACTN|nr:putative aminoacrylate hydrolase RutD [Acidithrix ferrooxidans]
MSRYFFDLTRKCWLSSQDYVVSDSCRSVILLVHGQPGNGELWGDLPSHLADSFDVLSYDRPGWGSNLDEPLDLAGNSRILDEEIKKVRSAFSLTGSGSRPLVVLGYSYGGAIVLGSKEVVDDESISVLLVAPAAEVSSIGEMDRLFETKFVGQLLSLISATLSKIATRDKVLGVLRHAHSLWYESVTMRSDFEALSKTLPLQRPVIVVAGLRDRIVPPTSISKLAFWLNNPDIEWVTHGSHLVVWRSPNVIAEIARSRAVKSRKV